MGKYYNAFIENVYYCRELNLVYMKNPKVACSTINRSVWATFDKKENVNTLKGNPHVRDNTAFQRNVSVIESSPFVFTFFRNPFDRILSAYLDKIVEPRDPNVWLPFCKQNNLRENEKLSFFEFLKLIQKTSIYDLDPHFMPQTLTTGYFILNFDFVGKFESFNNDFHRLEDMLGFSLNMSKFDPHATGANEKKMKYYDLETIDIVKDVFKDDFFYLGYSKDINVSKSVKPTKMFGITKIENNKSSSGDFGVSLKRTVRRLVW